MKVHISQAEHINLLKRKDPMQKSIIPNSLLSVISLALLVSMLPLASAANADSADRLIRIPITSLGDLQSMRSELDIVQIQPDAVEAVATDEQIMMLRGLGLDVSIEHGNFSELLLHARVDYPSLSELQDFIDSLSSTYSSICSVDTIGITYEDRPIQVVKVSDNVGTDESEPELLFLGLTHGNEWPSLVVCQFLLDTLTAGYQNDSTITDIVDGREIYVIPCMNPDGYNYSHTNTNNWRKNRRVYSSYTGVDLNRNFGGSCSGAPEGTWGTTIDGTVTHSGLMSYNCGPYPFSEAETQAVRGFIDNHDLVGGMTFHTYGEWLLWPWANADDATQPNLSYLEDLGEDIASVITRMRDTTDTYHAGKAGDSLYHTTGNFIDWGFGYGHYKLASDNLMYLAETCAGWYQIGTDTLNQVIREVFDGSLVLMQEAASIRTSLIPRVLPPKAVSFDTSASGSFALHWSPNEDGDSPTAWKINQLSGYGSTTDSAEGANSCWELDGWSRSTQRQYSGSYSYKSDYTNNTATALTTFYPYLVEDGDSLTFYIWSGFHTGAATQDVAVVEVSHDKRSWKSLEVFGDRVTFWQRNALSLEDYEGEQIFIRFRFSADEVTTGEGVYIDDISPTPFFTSDEIIDSALTDTVCYVTGLDEGTFYYRVAGYSSTWGWCDYSELEDVIVDYDDVGTITGTVTDSTTDMLLTGVLIEVLDGQTVIASDSTYHGRYMFAEIDTGTYDIRALSYRFDTKTITDLSVGIQDADTVDFELNPTAVCGDVNGSGNVDVDDIVYLNYYVYYGGPAPSPLWTGNVDCSGGIDIDDLVYLTNYVYNSGPVPCAECK